MIPFTRSPAVVTIGEALGLAGRYWKASWERWVLAVVAVGLASGLAKLMLGAGLLDQQAVARSLTTGGAIDPTTVPTLLAGPLAVAIVSLVADWFLVANAIIGLRGGEMPTTRTIGAGLRLLLVACAVAPVAFAVVLLLAMLGLLGVLGLIALVPVVIYVGIRLQLWVTALFDGAGVGLAIRTSWDLTRGAMLRVLGWGLVLAGVSLLISLGTGAVDLALRAWPALPAAIVAAASTAFQAYSVIVIAILYESQRLRSIQGMPAPSGWASTAVVPTGWGQPGATPPTSHEPGPADPDDPAAPAGPPPPPGGPGA